MAFPPSEPAPGRRKKQGKSLPTPPTLYPFPQGPRPKPFWLSRPGDFSSLTSPATLGGKKESEEMATLIFLELQLKTLPPPQRSRVLWSQGLYFALVPFSECLFIEHEVGRKGGRKGNLELAVERNKRTSNEPSGFGLHSRAP